MCAGVTMMVLHFLHHSSMNIISLGLTDNIYLAVCFGICRNALSLESRPYSCLGLGETPVWVLSSHFIILPLQKSLMLGTAKILLTLLLRQTSSGIGKLISALGEEMDLS